MTHIFICDIVQVLDVCYFLLVHHKMITKSKTPLVLKELHDHGRLTEIGLQVNKCLLL